MLEKIVTHTKKRIKKLKEELSFEEVKKLALHSSIPSPFINLFESKVIIAEIKFRSPSKGIIRAEGNVETITRDYLSAGACAISVLTEPEFFGGDYNFIKRLRNEFPNISILQKDFFVDPYQIYMARYLGANSILLMASVLDENELEYMLSLALELGIHPILEVHNEKELALAEKLNAPIIGVNNRNLKTLKVDLENSFNLSRKFNKNRFYISESGIQSSKDIKELSDVGFNGFLIGSH